MRAFAVVTAGFVVSVSTLAGAQPPYPGKLQEKLKMPCVPSCMLCHTVPEGGADKVNSFGFDGRFIIDGVFDGRTKCGTPVDGRCDHDRDGKLDADELVAGESPVLAGSVSVCAPEYGCGARVAKAPAPGGLQSESLLLGALGFGVLLRWQLRRRTSDRR